MNSQNLTEDEARQKEAKEQREKFAELKKMITQKQKSLTVDDLLEQINITRNNLQKANSGLDNEKANELIHKINNSFDVLLNQKILHKTNSRKSFDWFSSQKYEFTDVPHVKKQQKYLICILIKLSSSLISSLAQFRYDSSTHKNAGEILTKQINKLGLNLETVVNEVNKIVESPDVSQHKRGVRK